MEAIVGGFWAPAVFTSMPLAGQVVAKLLDPSVDFAQMEAVTGVPVRGIMALFGLSVGIHAGQKDLRIGKTLTAQGVLEAHQLGLKVDAELLGRSKRTLARSNTKAASATKKLSDRAKKWKKRAQKWRSPFAKLALVQAENNLNSAEREQKRAAEYSKLLSKEQGQGQ